MLAPGDGWWQRCERVGEGGCQCCGGRRMMAQPGGIVKAFGAFLGRWSGWKVDRDHWMVDDAVTVVVVAVACRCW